MLTAAELDGLKAPILHKGAIRVEGKHWRDDSPPERVQVGVMPRSETKARVIAVMADGRFRPYEQLVRESGCRADGVRKCVRRLMAHGEVVLIEVAGMRLFGASEFKG